MLFSLYVFFCLNFVLFSVCWVLSLKLISSQFCFSDGLRMASGVHRGVPTPTCLGAVHLGVPCCLFFSLLCYPVAIFWVFQEMGGSFLRLEYVFFFSPKFFQVAKFFSLNGAFWGASIFRLVVTEVPAGYWCWCLLGLLNAMPFSICGCTSIFISVYIYI